MNPDHAAPPEMHRYFVSYWWVAGLHHGYGNLVADLESPIRSAVHVADLSLMVADEAPLPDGAKISIANIVRLDTL
jgi:hypothetical protein